MDQNNNQQDLEQSHGSFSEIQIGGGSFVEVTVSSDSSDKDTKEQTAGNQSAQQTPSQPQPKAPNDAVKDVLDTGDKDQQEPLPARRSKGSKGSKMSSEEIVDRFNGFVAQRQKVVFSIDESRVDLAPPQLRASLNTLIKRIKRWANRNPSNGSLEALQVLAERLDEYLELQVNRDDPHYDSHCRDLLAIVYQNTIEAQRLVSTLQESARPRPLDEID